MTGRKPEQRGADEPGRIVAVELDPRTIPRSSADVEDERAVAISDLLDDNLFQPVGQTAGRYRLRMAVVERKLVFDIADENNELLATETLSLQPFRKLVSDYFLICDSYYEAVRTASPQRVEAIDMGRRAMHDEASAFLRERLEPRITVDMETARRLFTLICALHWKG